MQLPVLNWIRKKYNIDFVDVVTAAGIDRLIASQDNIGTIIKSVNISINTNKSTRIFIVAHHDCRGNPVDKKTHREHIIKSVKCLKSHWPELEIVGLWVNSHWQAEVWYKSPVISEKLSL